MSLREEIRLMVMVERFDHRDHSKVYSYQAINNASINAIINKILDAAAEAVIEIYDPDFPPTAAVNAINKLRRK